MSTSSTESRHILDNESVMDTDTLLEWADIIEETIEQVNTETDHTGYSFYNKVLRVISPVKYSSVENSLLCSVLSTDDDDIYQVVLDLDMETIFDDSYEEEEREKEFMLRLVDVFGEVVESESIPNDSYQGAERIESGLYSILKERFR